MKATVKKESAKESVKETETKDMVYFWNDSEIDEGTHKKLTEDHRLWVIAEEEKSAALQVARLTAEKKNSEDMKLARKNRKAEKLARK
jgi:hypothetical protein